MLIRKTVKVEVSKERHKALSGERGTRSAWVGWKDCWNWILKIMSWADGWWWLESEVFEIMQV